MTDGGAARTLAGLFREFVRAILHDVRGGVVAMAKEDDQNYGRLLALGLEMAVGVLVGLFVGRWLDRKYDWTPWGTLIGAMLGVAAGMYLLIKDAIRLNK